AYGHRAPWFDEDLTGTSQSHRLYRFFEFLDSSNRAAGVAPGGRVPGKVNINTVWDLETLLALCDPEPGNSNAFDAMAVMNIFNALVQQRSTAAGGAPGQFDRPFWSLAAGFYPPNDPQFPSLDNMGNPLPPGPNNNNTGVNSSLLRSATIGGAGNTQRLFQKPTCG